VTTCACCSSRATQSAAASIGTASIIAEHPAKDRIEEELRQFKSANPPEARVPLEKQVRLFAQVKWLEQNGTSRTTA
jgi:hypothetical protein